MNPDRTGRTKPPNIGVRRTKAELRAEICDMLNRRNYVESALWRAAGTKTPIEPGQARELAIRLGVPSEYQKKVDG